MNLKADLIRLRETFEESRCSQDHGEINKVQCKIVEQLAGMISRIDNNFFCSVRAEQEPEEYIDVDFFAVGDGIAVNVEYDRQQSEGWSEKFLEKSLDCDAMGNKITYESCIKLQCGEVALAYTESCQSYYLEEIERLKCVVKKDATEPLNGWYLVRYESAMGRISEIPAQLRDKQWFSTEFSGIPIAQAVIISPVLIKY
jgi:hypothetical protein